MDLALHKAEHLSPVWQSCVSAFSLWYAEIEMWKLPLIGVRTGFWTLLDAEAILSTSQEMQSPSEATVPSSFSGPAEVMLVE